MALRKAVSNLVFAGLTALAPLSANAIPIADAGPDQVVPEGTTVFLDGTGSTGAGPLTYLWEFVGGLPVTIQNETSAMPFFVAPEVPTGGATSTMRLTVDDTTGVDIDLVNVNITNINAIPIVDAGPDQTVAPGSLVQLSGSATDDGKEAPLIFFWDQLSGDPVTLSDEFLINPTFLAPGSEGILTFEFFAFDGQFVPSDKLTIRVAEAVPLPTTLALLGLGLAGFCQRFRKTINAT